MLQQALSAAGSVLANLDGLIGPFSRFYAPYLATAALLAFIAFRLNRKALEARGRKDFLAYLFDRRVYLHPSSLVDLKVVLANRLFTPFLALASRAATVTSAYWIASQFVDPETAKTDPTLLALAVMTVAITFASDFTSYWVHRLHHENPVFWPFHKLHHSAETLTPITFARKHPVYDLIRAVSNAFLVGPVQGLIFAAFGASDLMTILGVNVIYATFYWGGANLRHSHIWLSYGPFWSRIFISPAQHQIHHSCAPEHHDRNYGEIFALWDWMFGTLYTPDAYEDLEFGVAGADGVRIEQPHPTLRDAWLAPFRESGAALISKTPSSPARREPGPVA